MYCVLVAETRSPCFSRFGILEGKPIPEETRSMQEDVFSMMVVDPSPRTILYTVSTFAIQIFAIVPPGVVESSPSGVPE